MVQSIGFSKYLPVGSPEVAVEFLNTWGVDEIVVLEIERGLDLALVGRLAEKSMVPLTIGGGITSVGQMRELIHGGADKISINRAALNTPEIISEAASIFGNQCVVVSIDVRAGEEEQAALRAKEVQRLGAGEILLRRVERDGAGQGYDTALIERVSKEVSIPVIAAGGCGSPRHIQDAFAAGADAASVGNTLHFSEHSVITIKQQLAQAGTPVRLDTHTTYEGFGFDERGRLQKKDDAYLEKLRFEYHPPEII